MPAAATDRPSSLMRASGAARSFFRKADNDGLFDKSGVLAFQALFSIIPMLALAYFIFALSGGLEQVRADLERFAVSNLAPAVGDQLVGYLRTIQERVSPGAIGVFGVLGFLWAGVNMISKIEQALNGIWGLRHARSFRQRLWLYTAVAVAAPLVLGASLAMTSFLAARTERVGALGPGLGWLLTFAPLALSIAFFSLVYWALPHTRVSGKAAFKAGAVTAVLLEGLKQGFAFYAAWSLGDSIYGSLAALPILFLWLSLGSTLFLLGAELCYFLDAKEAGASRVARAESRLSFPLLVDILRLHQASLGPLGLKRVAHELDWDLSEVIRHAQYLADQGLLRAAHESADGPGGEERYAASEARFESAFARLVERVNEVKYGRLEVRRPEGGRAGPDGAESDASLEDRVWAPWGVRRPPHPMP